MARTPQSLPTIDDQPEWQEYTAELDDLDQRKKNAERDLEEMKSIRGPFGTNSVAREAQSIAEHGAAETAVMKAQAPTGREISVKMREVEVLQQAFRLKYDQRETLQRKLTRPAMMKLVPDHLKLVKTVAAVARAFQAAIRAEAEYRAELERNGFTPDGLFGRWRQAIAHREDVRDGGTPIDFLCESIVDHEKFLANEQAALNANG